jgi:hypothetical protein
VLIRYYAKLNKQIFCRAKLSFATLSGALPELIKEFLLRNYFIISRIELEQKQEMGLK